MILLKVDAMTVKAKKTEAVRDYTQSHTHKHTVTPPLPFLSHTQTHTHTQHHNSWSISVARTGPQPSLNTVTREDANVT